MNKVIIGLLVVLAAGSAGWAMYERIQKEMAIALAEQAEASALESKKMAIMQQHIANELRKQLDAAMERAEEATARMEACCSKKK